MHRLSPIDAGIRHQPVGHAIGEQAVGAAVLQAGRGIAGHGRRFSLARGPSLHELSLDFKAAHIEVQVEAHVPLQDARIALLILHAQRSRGADF